MSARALFFEEEDAREAVRRLAAEGYAAELARERFAGEDDDEDAHWIVTTAAADSILEIVTEDLDTWVEYPQAPRSAPLTLPHSPRHLKREDTP